ncbi:tripartite tricarboxylate transporter substrate binding protein [Bordetella sp. LUAb4]|uniref:Bug family tripartite tricarboxylate transporter substrate binding protein n=1 Tax=Bordetella sp. LUAb4 TaxID=2843195 RepID=UPI001E419704|nr:tripartite tricarboxylate transporter substrate binding protein [Bordetella sp. LUAb4]
MLNNNTDVARRGFGCRLLAVFGAAAGLILAQPSAWADYPDKPIRLIVGSNTGGGGDTTARVVAEALSKKLGTSIIVDNRPGASGNIGAAFVARAEPDGYTLLFAYTGHVINPALFSNMPFDTVKDFRAVGKIGDNQSMLVVNEKIPAQTLAEFIGLARKQPDHYSFASLFGTDQYMTARLLAQSQDVKFLFVPYKGNAAALNDVLSGQVDAMVNTVGVTAPFVRAGKLRALAVMSKTRSSLLPEVPTLQEAGVQGVASGGWYGLMAPAGVSDAVIAKLGAALAAVLTEKKVGEDMRKLGVEPSYVPAQAFDAFIKAEVPRWQKFTADAGIRPE